MKRVALYILLTLVLGVLLLAAGLLGALYYFHAHPATLRGLAEMGLSRATGGKVSIGRVQYSLRPLKIEAGGIRLGSGERLRGVTLAIATLSGRLALEGPPGHRTLVLESVTIEGPRLEITPDFRFRPVERVPGGPGVPVALLKGLLQRFLFRDVVLGGGELKGGHVMGRLGDIAFSAEHLDATLTPEHVIQVSCRGRLESPSRGILVEDALLGFHADGRLSLAPPVIAGRFEARGGALQGPPADVEGYDIQGRLLYRHPTRDLTIDSLVLDLKKVRIKRGPPSALPALKVLLQANGRADLAGGGFEIPGFSLRVGNRLELKGALGPAQGDGGGYTLRIASGRAVAEEFLALVPEERLRALGSPTLSGPIGLGGHVTGRPLNGGWLLDCDLTARLAGNPIAVPLGGVGLKGTLTGDIRARGPVKDLQVGARLDVRGDGFSRGDLSVGPYTAQASMAWSSPRLELTDATLHIPLTTLARLRGAPKTVSALEISVPEGTLNLEREALIIPRMRWTSSLLKDLFFEIRSERDRVHVGLKGENTGLLDAFQGLDLLPAGWRAGGRDRLEISLEKKGSADWTLHLGLGLQALSLGNGDGTLLGEGLALAMTCRGNLSKDFSRLEAETSLEADAGELLLDRFYFNLENTPYRAAVEGRYDRERRRLDIGLLEQGLEGIGSCRITGALWPGGPYTRAEATLRVPPTPLSPLLRHFIIEPFKTDTPVLSAMETGGDLSAAVEFSRRGPGAEVKGRVILSDGKLEIGPRGIGLEGIELDFPLWMAFGGPAPAGRPLPGRLHIDSLRLPGFPEQPLTLEASLRPNRLSLEQPTLFRIPGGSVEMGPLDCRGLYTPGRRVQTRLSFRDVDVAPLLSRVWDRPIAGSLSGSLNPVTLSDGGLITEGDIRGYLFGGQVVLSDPAAAGITTSTPLIQLDASWEGLHLAEMTRDTSFGKIEGILKGSLRDLQVAFGQPQRFELLMETVKTPGIDQRISIRAVDNIARIGGGQSPFMGMAGILTSFFKEFPYRKIGIRASLENDVFRVNGTIKEGETEYLIKRSSFSGVNVVNQNPDNRISFKDMVKRIKRVTASKRGPVIR